MQQLEPFHAVSHQNKQFLLHSMQLINLTRKDQLAASVDILGYVYKYGTYWKIRIKVSQVTNIISHCQKMLEDPYYYEPLYFILTKD